MFETRFGFNIVFFIFFIVFTSKKQIRFALVRIFWLAISESYWGLPIKNFVTLHSGT